jgi:riboflavin kinase/FMN adenylyltransferase
MRIDDFLRPAFGVYAVRATILEDDKPKGTYGGVANFGIRPMYRITTPLLETYLFDFSGDLYGKHLQVEFISYLRGEEKFDSLEALKRQIATDSANAATILRQL